MTSVVLDGVDVGLTAAGNALADGTKIGRLAKLSRFTTVSSLILNCANLPAVPVQYAEYQIKNDGAFPLRVFPATATDTVNGNAVGVAYWIGVGGSATFVCTTTTAAAAVWIVTSENTRRVVRAITASITLTKADSGHLFTIPALGGAVAITLPLLSTAPYMEFSIANTAATGQAVTVVSNATDAKCINGHAVNVSTWTLTATGAPATTVNMAATGATLGNTIQIWSNGTSWEARATSCTAAIMTFVGA